MASRRIAFQVWTQSPSLITDCATQNC